MGCIFSLCSADSLPPIPANIQAPPDVNAVAQFSVGKLGFWGRDYGVWKGSAPGKAAELWFWINKSDGAQPGTGTIDMEDFNRDEKKKGKVFWSASIIERPVFDQFQRAAVAGVGSYRFQGINNQAEDPDDHYINHHVHVGKKARTNISRGPHTGAEVGERVQDIGAPVISKWRLHTTATIRDGNLGRGRDIVGNDPIILEVLSTGSGATCWQQVEKHYEEPDGTPAEGQPQKYRVGTSRSVNKIETEWVDKIEFRLSCRGQLIAQPWVVEGDAHAVNTDGVMRSTFFDAVVKGGFFSKSSVETTTKPGLDPILALLVSHLCATEFSIAEIKSDLRLNTPAQPPNSPWAVPQASSLAYRPAQPVNHSTPFPWGAVAAGLGGVALATGAVLSGAASSAYNAAANVDWEGGANRAGNAIKGGAYAAGSAIEGGANSAYNAAASVDWEGGANRAGAAIESGAYAAGGAIESGANAVGNFDYGGAADRAGAAIESGAYSAGGAIESGADAVGNFDYGGAAASAANDVGGAAQEAVGAVEEIISE